MKFYEKEVELRGGIRGWIIIIVWWIFTSPIKWPEKVCIDKKGSLTIKKGSLVNAKTPKNTWIQNKLFEVRGGSCCYITSWCIIAQPHRWHYDDKTIFQIMQIIYSTFFIFLQYKCKNILRSQGINFQIRKKKKTNGRYFLYHRWWSASKRL